MSKIKSLNHPAFKSPSIERAKAIDAQSPYDELIQAIKTQSPHTKEGKTIVHWFRNKDLRIQDNSALYQASQQANKENKPLICIYLYCVEELIGHGIAPAKLDLMLETLKHIQTELTALNIPLVVINIKERATLVSKLSNFLHEHDATHLYANYEYEIDELRRDIQLLKQANAQFKLHLYHDQCIIPPKHITNAQGKPMQVFTPYHKAWVNKVKQNPQLLNTLPSPTKNKPETKKSHSFLFNQPIPHLPKEKSFRSQKECMQIRQLWPAGHTAALERLHHFINEKIESYHETRNYPAIDSTSRMSPYFAAGIISMRETLSAIKAYNKNHANFSQNGCSPGLYAWVRELVFREFYRQQLAATPHTAMNLPHNLKFTETKWQEDEEGWYKWCDGQTGIPFIDAGMRQLKQEAYMHNRLRMNVASYLRTNLLIDYRRGERFFAETLIDWDLANNTYGWEPSYIVFNPVLQAEKNDPKGEYIRKWVPELKHVKGKAIFDPYHRLKPSEFEKLGYPTPHVDFNKTKKRAIGRFKHALSN